MKRTIIKISLFLLLFFCFLALSTTSHANTINSIDIDVYIDSTGTANVTEVWRATLNDGTEGYKPYGDLGNCEIIDCTVNDDTGAV